ncbi:MAG: iron-containing alcohol dehydrogenase [bacterium]|nr:iron-containing alcohol dehydrogenase [bacterium]
MDNFIFNAYTKVYFGKGEMNQLPNEIHKYGTNVLLVYGGGSIKRNGIYSKALELLKDCNVIELPGVEPNPKIESVRKGVTLCKENKIDVILAIGGGSTIDCSKVIGAGAYYEGDAWDLVTNPEKITKVLPIVTVLTIAATGSEMNKNAVISDPVTNEKLGTSSMLMIPQASFLDPEYLYTLPAKQTAAGTADIMSHIFENYFKEEVGAFVQDKFAEGLLKTCIKYCPVALKDPTNYEARANLMWASTMALNGLVGAGKPGPWICHPIEHELSAFYDITHGIGLAILTPRWMRYTLNEKTLELFVRYARNVWDIEEEDPFIASNMAIDKTEQFFIDCGIPMSLKELGIDDTHFEEMAEKAVRIGGLEHAYVPLNKEDVIHILRKCL